jgi:hypothetical protein
VLTIPNLPTQDRYVDALTLGPVAETVAIKYVVANKSVLARIWPKSKSGTILAQTDELLITPETNIITNTAGIQFRSAVPGVPAQVIAQLLQPGDPLLGSGSPFSATISGGGGISPGVSAVQIQKDGALIATEPIIDFITNGILGWNVSDDGANTRVLVGLDGLFTKIAEVSAVNSFIFSNIPATFRHLLVLGSIQTQGPAASADNPIIRFNNYVVGPYDYVGAAFNSGGPFYSGGNALGYSQPMIGMPSQLTSIGDFIGFLPDVNQATGHRCSIWLSASDVNPGVAGNAYVQIGMVNYRGAAARISRIDIGGNGFAFAANSVTLATLYGIA